MYTCVSWTTSPCMIGRLRPTQTLVSYRLASLANPAKLNFSKTPASGRPHDEDDPILLEQRPPFWLYVGRDQNGGLGKVKLRIKTGKVLRSATFRTQDRRRPPTSLLQSLLSHSAKFTPLENPGTPQLHTAAGSDF